MINSESVRRGSSRAPAIDPERMNQGQRDRLLAATQRDDRNIHRDDCVELFIDPDRVSLKTYYHILINSLGTVSDKHQTGDRGWDRNWNP